MHDGPASLVACAECGLLRRAEEATLEHSNYAEDANDPVIMQLTLPRYVDAFRKKREAFEPVAPASAEVLEVGSHLGAFLSVAEEWNWRPTGLDPGRDTSAFARRQGVSVLRERIEDARLRPGSFDSVFLWNCFDQLSDPRRTLDHAWRVLKRWGSQR